MTLHALIVIVFIAMFAVPIIFGFSEGAMIAANLLTAALAVLLLLGTLHLKQGPKK